LFPIYPTDSLYINDTGGYIQSHQYDVEGGEKVNLNMA